jgi:hypothetical protein
MKRLLFAAVMALGVGAFAQETIKIADLTLHLKKLFK